jgi:hypothetical protein
MASSESSSVPAFDKQIPRDEPAHALPAKRRIASFCGAAMIAVSLTGMYFRGDFAAYVIQQDNQTNNPLDVTIEQPRKVSLASDSLGQALTVGISVPAPAAEVTSDSALPQSPENHRRADALEKELLKNRQTLTEAREREILSKQAAEAATTALQQSLDKIAILENELALARRHIDQGSPSSRRTHRIPQRRAGQLSRQDFFGLFNPAPNRVRFQHSARIR